MTRAQQADHDTAVRAASTLGGERGQSRRRPLPRSASSMTDAEPGGRDVVSEIMDAGPGGIIGDLVRPTTGVRDAVDEPRHYQRGKAAGVHPDVDDHTACATCSDPGEGEAQLDVSGDERIDSGQAEQDWLDRTSRHRADNSSWPREQPAVPDRTRSRYAP